MTAWVAVLGAGIATYLLRWAPARWATTHEVPERLRRGLTFVAPAAFAALAAPAVVVPTGAAAPAVARVLAIGVALPVARVTRSTPVTLVAGLTVLWLATLVSGP
jgi:branched-subunit amino acid transport protein